MRDIADEIIERNLGRVMNDGALFDDPSLIRVGWTIEIRWPWRGLKELGAATPPKSGDRWRINGIIDWETTTTGSPLVDIGSLFRYSRRYDRAFCDAFEAGYRDGGGELPEGWLLTSRLLDATWLVDMLNDDNEHTAVFADCRKLVANLVAELG